MTQEQERALPSNLDAERLILGSIMLDGTRIISVAGALEVEDFSLDKHRTIYKRMCDMAVRDARIDRVTLANELIRNKELEAVDGLTYLLSLDEGMPSLPNLDSYVEIVKQKSLLRRIVATASDTLNRAMLGLDDPSKILSEANARMMTIAQDDNRSGPATVAEIVKGYEGGINAMLDPSKRAAGLPTGFFKLDEMTGGFRPGELIILAARPSMGKTALACNIAEHVALRLGKLPVVFSLEMSRDSLLQRSICSTARVDGTRFRAGYIGQDERKRLMAAATSLYESKLMIDDKGSITVTDIYSRCQRLKAEWGELDLVVVDYLQLLTGRGKSENRQQEVSLISRMLKLMAKDLNVPVLALSQLSRAPETRGGDHRPQLSDLRESGCLTGETLITMATGERRPIKDLVGGQHMVMALDENWRACRKRALKVWQTGDQPVLEIKTASGRSIRATGNHPFKTAFGFTAASELKAGDRIAVLSSFPTIATNATWSDHHIVLAAHLIGDGCMAPRQPIHYTSPSSMNIAAVSAAASALFGITPRIVRQENWWHVYLGARANKWHRNPLTLWLESVGLNEKRAADKFVPLEVFGLPLEKIRLFLSHLWSTDGTACTSKGGVDIAYSTTSRSLALGVQELLSRCDVAASIYSIKQQGAHRDVYQLSIGGTKAKQTFLKTIGVHGELGAEAPGMLAALETIKSSGQADLLPTETWMMIKFAIAARKLYVPSRELRSRSAPTRTTVSAFASRLDWPELAQLAQAEVRWDKIVSITEGGTEAVYDMTVDDVHNFTANGFVVKNSIEQDADVVAFIFREEVYKRDREDLRGLAELILAKQRNGPVGKMDMIFIHSLTRFENRAEDLGEAEAA